MLKTTAPYETLTALRESLGLGNADHLLLIENRAIFEAAREEFATFFFAKFHEIGETRFIMEHRTIPDRLRRLWAEWFSSIFVRGIGEDLMAYLWRIGGRHVEVGLDQRYSNLGFSAAREFCQGLIAEALPAKRALPLQRAVSKLLDFCLLVETSAYIDTTSRCDLAVMRGIADRVRNPSAVIGGHVRRLMSKSAPGDPAREAYGTVLEENDRIATIASDVRTYVELFDEVPRYERVSVGACLDEVLGRLGPPAAGKGCAPAVSRDPVADLVISTPALVTEMLDRLVRNAFDACERVAGDPVAISVSIDRRGPSNTRIEISNPAEAMRAEDVLRMFSPFYSTKHEGTGLGLPIALLAARKSSGSIEAAMCGPQRLCMVLTLPRPNSSDSSG
jgi:signal transduction histidine kinase